MKNRIGNLAIPLALLAFTSVPALAVVSPPTAFRLIFEPSIGPIIQAIGTHRGDFYVLEASTNLSGNWNSVLTNIAGSQLVFNFSYSSQIPQGPEVFFRAVDTTLLFAPLEPYYTFPATVLETNNDGASPQGGLVLSGSPANGAFAAYGTTEAAGVAGSGTVFALLPGVNFGSVTATNLYSFTAPDPITDTNSDGANPSAELLLSGSALYGTAEYGGSDGDGTIFAVNTNGVGFRVLHSFTALDSNTGTNADGADPVFVQLILSSNILYGTTSAGGAGGAGTVFSVNTNGSDFTVLHSFAALDATTGTNCDGANPAAGLILSGNTLFGCAYDGGSFGKGTVFAINTDGCNFTNLHDFTAVDATTETNNDGAYPSSTLVLSDNTLFGTAYEGGTHGNGTVFALGTDGSNFKDLYSFTTLDAETNSDGANPIAGLILERAKLYGTASFGGPNGTGTVFAINTDGSSFTNLQSFAALQYDDTSSQYTNSHGAYPYAPLTVTPTGLIGTATEGGMNGNGVVFTLGFQ